MITTVTFRPDKRSLASQVTFALASSMTATAKDGQAESIKEIGGTFTVRNSWPQPGNKFGVKITPATKAKLETSVGTDASWLEPFEEGGVKKPRGRAIALPVIGGARPSFASKIPARNLPRNLAAKAFVLATKAGAMLFVRKGRGKKKSLAAQYFLDPIVRVTVHSVLFEPVKRIFETRFQENYNKAQEKALQTAK